MPRRRSGDDEDAWADLHEGDMAMGQIHELREAHPVGKPFEPRRGALGFLEYDGDTLKNPRRLREKRGRKTRNGKP